MRLQTLTREVQREKSTALAVHRDQAMVVQTGKKSVLAATGLPLLLGPFGLLYSAPLRISLPVMLAWLTACGLLPTFMIAWMVGIVHPLSAAAGAYFALDHNAGVDEGGQR
jgi:hypothetical protein